MPRWACLSLLLAGILAPLAGRSEPLHLADPHARPVAVRFEVSPPELPARQAAVFTRDLPARLEPGPAEGQVTISVPARQVEQVLFAGERVVAGSFSDFVWTFDVRTGHVLSATLSGRVVRSLAFGPLHSESEVALQVELSTLAPAGFEPPQVRLGQLVFHACTRQDLGCTLVPATPLDPRTGYVNAVGHIAARVLQISTQSFAPLGEAIFSERAGPEGPVFSDRAAPEVPASSERSAADGSVLASGAGRW